MTSKEKDLMERYIYEVTRRVAKDQREDIAMELRELISDMCEQENENGEEMIEKDTMATATEDADATTMYRVLENLGDPAEFAKKYRDENSVLIGPEYYDNYIWVLKIVVITTVLVAIVSSAFEGIIAGGAPAAILGMWIGESIGEGIAAFISSFGAVTLIFALLERRKVKIDLSDARKNWNVKDLETESVPAKMWTPIQLPPMPDKRGMISRSDCIVSVIFILIFCGFLTLAPQLFGVMHFENGQLVSSITVFNLEKWNMILPVFLASMMVGLIDEVIKLVHGYYCKTVFYCSLACNVIQVVLAVVLIKVLPIWNPNFEAELRAFGGTYLESASQVNVWDPVLVGNVILGFIVAISLFEICVTAYKTWKYGVEVR